MAFDGIAINALAYELSEKICNGRIEKIYQPEKDELYINIRNNKKNYTLLLSSNTNNPRIYLTDQVKSNPLTPPTFCMLLRKNLTRGKILSIRQPSMERMLEIEISSINELGDPAVKVLSIEIMGRHSNIILMDKESKRIIDSIKRIGSNISRYRQVLPGNEYIYPPNQDKINPLEVEKEEVYNLLNAFSKGKHIDKFFVTTFTGISPIVSREICFISGIHYDQYIETLTEKQKKYLIESFFHIIELIKTNQFLPNIIYNENQSKLIDFSLIPMRQYSEFPTKTFDSPSSLLEQFYYERDKLERIKQKNSGLLHQLNTKLERAYKKLGLQKNEYKTSQDSMIFKLYGELITSNMYQLKKGVDKALLENFYSEENEEIEITLDPNLTPIENAQKYFKKYNKSKNAINQLDKQIKSTEDEIYYLESQIENIKNCTELEEMEEIKDELRKEGYLSKVSKKKTSSKQPAPSSPLHFISSNNLDIYVGKNNRQNDYLTLKFANENNLWFHTKNIPGSHVIIKASANEIPEDTILEAALLAAFYSKARQSGNVPVDYTKVKNVKKPKSAKPGMVIYDINQTVYVTPSEEKIHLLKRIK